MAGETIITIIGNLTADPELRTTQAGGTVAGFTVACSERQYNKDTGQYEDTHAIFVRVSAWRDLAAHCAQSLGKGMRVIVRGKLRQNSYTAKDGTQRQSIELVADEIGPSLKYANASVTKAVNAQGAPPQPPTVGGFQPAGTAQDPWSQPPQDDPWAQAQNEPQF